VFSAAPGRRPALVIRLSSATQASAPVQLGDSDGRDASAAADLSTWQVPLLQSGPQTRDRHDQLSRCFRHLEPGRSERGIAPKLHRAHRKDLDPDGGSLRGFLASLRERDRLLGRPVAAAGACSLRPTTWCAVRSCCPTRYGCSRQPGTIASRYTYSWTASGAARCMASCRPRLTAAKTPRAIQPRTVERETLAASVIRRSPGASSAVFTRALIDFSVLAHRVLSPRLYLR
jgi:hypothetical protein